ncbi:MAG: membrane protein [Bacteroidia bacterium]|nr:MAG: membrane protein [Bacteroidia bacterium]
MSAYLTIKALHIVFIVSWFAGLFYLVRLFIYTREAQDKPEPEKTILTEQLLLMQSKLWKVITFPAMVLTIVFGLWMLFYIPSYLAQSWMWKKLIFVAGLLIYQWYVYKIHIQQKQLIFKVSSIFLRILNEVATIFLIAIVFLAVFKTSTDYTRHFVVLIGFIGLIAVFFYLYNRKRRNKNN